MVQRPKLTVWGDYFDNDTRTIAILLNLSGVVFDFKELNTFVGQHVKADFAMINQACTIPFV